MTSDIDLPTRERSAPTVRYLTGKSRETVVTLEEPIEVDGIIYRSFTVRRLTARDLEDHRRKTPEERDERPLVNVDITRPVLDALDADDATTLQEAAYDFLPRSWKTAIEPTQPSPGPTPSSSDAGAEKGSNEASTGTGTTS